MHFRGIKSFNAWKYFIIILYFPGNPSHFSKSTDKVSIVYRFVTIAIFVYTPSMIIYLFEQVLTKYFIIFYFGNISVKTNNIFEGIPDWLPPWVNTSCILFFSITPLKQKHKNFLFGILVTWLPNQWFITVLAKATTHLAQLKIHV